MYSESYRSGGGNSRRDQSLKDASESAREIFARLIRSLNTSLASTTSTGTHLIQLSTTILLSAPTFHSARCWRNNQYVPLTFPLTLFCSRVTIHITYLPNQISEPDTFVDRFNAMESSNSFTPKSAAPSVGSGIGTPSNMSSAGRKRTHSKLADGDLLDHNLAKSRRTTPSPYASGAVTPATTAR